MKIAITGHRPHKLGNDYDLTSPLISWIENEIIEILERYKKSDEELILITGMALGIDTLFAKIAIKNKIKFIAAIPCKEQYIPWPKKSQETWYSIINNPLCIVYYISKESYTPECMNIRNKWMVDNCDLLIGVWDGSSGGTKNCIDYAVSQNKIPVIINPKNHEIIT